MKRAENGTITPICLVLEDGKRLKYGEHDLFDNFSIDEEIEVYRFGSYKMFSKKYGIIKEMKKIDGVNTIILDWKT